MPPALTTIWTCRTFFPKSSSDVFLPVQLLYLVLPNSFKIRILCFRHYIRDFVNITQCLIRHDVRSLLLVQFLARSAGRWSFPRHATEILGWVAHQPGDPLRVQSASGLLVQLHLCIQRQTVPPELARTPVVRTVLNGWGWPHLRCCL